MNISTAAKKTYKYKLQDFATAFKISLPLAQKWVSQVIPEEFVDREGRGKNTRYGENTWNNIKFIQELRKQAALSGPQITEVMRTLGQVSINSIAKGDEALEIGQASINADGQISIPRQYKDALDRQDVVVVSGKHVELINKSNRQIPRYSLSGKKERTQEKTGWHTYPIGENIELRIKGELSDSQLNELLVAARLIKIIVDEDLD